MAWSKVASGDKDGAAPRVAWWGPEDESFELYLEWREDLAAAEDAYAVWSRAPAREKAACFAAYRAATEREEAAARNYACALAEVERWHRRGAR